MGPHASRAEVIETDVLDPASLARALDTILQRFGSVDALINGAGGNHPKATAGANASFFDLPPEALRWVFDLNLIGTILPSPGVRPRDGQGRRRRSSSTCRR